MTPTIAASLEAAGWCQQSNDETNRQNQEIIVVAPFTVFLVQ